MGLASLAHGPSLKATCLFLRAFLSRVDHAHTHHVPYFFA